MNKALFIDRDGVINVDRNHVIRKEDFEFKEGIFEFCRKFTDVGYLLIVITNQAGIAKGLYTADEFLELTAWMKEQFLKNDIIITQVYFCPHHPDITGYCACRKPAPGMILQAVREHDLDILQCILIGDKESDLQAGRNAGIPESNLHLFTGESFETIKYPF